MITLSPLLLSTATPLIINDLIYNRISLSLTCTSSGGLVDSITWLRDGSEVRGESTVFSQTQILSDASSATYQHILSSEDTSNLVGSFTCRVVEVSGNMVERTLALNGDGLIDNISRDIQHEGCISLI